MKRYFKYKNKKYGYENLISIRLIGGVCNIPFTLYNLLIKGMKLFLLMGLTSLVKWNINNLYIDIAYNIIASLSFIYLLCMFVKMVFVNCRFASQDVEIVKEHIEKMCKRDIRYKERVTEIQKIDDWFMVFEK